MVLLVSPVTVKGLLLAAMKLSSSSLRHICQAVAVPFSVHESVAVVPPVVAVQARPVGMVRRGVQSTVWVTGVFSRPVPEKIRSPLLS